MAKKLPVENLKVGVYDIPIKYATNMLEGTARNAIGEFDPVKLEITLHEYLPEQKQRAVLCHEVTHAFVETYNIPMPEELESMEMMVDMFGMAMFAFIKDNPEIVKWLTKSK